MRSRWCLFPLAPLAQWSEQRTHNPSGPWFKSRMGHERRNTWKSKEASTRRERNWLMVAGSVAESSRSRSRHGAIIVRGGRIIATGYNRSRTHNAWVFDRARRDCSIHAELSALRLCSSGRGSTLYVVRLNKVGAYRFSAPCSDCREALEEAGIKRVIHS